MGQLAITGVDALSDIAGVTPTLEDYYFNVQAGAAVTLTGFFVDSLGRQIGQGISNTPAANASYSFAALAGLTVLPGTLGSIDYAVGFIGILSGTGVITMGLGNLSGFTTVANLVPLPLSATAIRTFGRVSKATCQLLGT